MFSATAVLEKMTLLTLAFILVLFVNDGAARAEGNNYTCLDGIGETLDSLQPGSKASICPDYAENWEIELLPRGGSRIPLTDGTITQLFDLRQRGWQSTESSTLEFNFVPFRPNVWEVQVLDVENNDRERASINGRSIYFIWARDTKTYYYSGVFRPYGNKWQPVRFFRCYPHAGSGCISYYDVLICRRYLSPSFPQVSLRVEPKIIVRAIKSEGSPEQLEDFEDVHGLIEEALERLLEHSCR